MIRRRHNAAFTLVELLVVIAIIGILIALLLPAVQAAREAARRSQCSNNLKQLGLALHNYENTYKVLCRGGGGPWFSGRPQEFSGLVSLLPFFEQKALYDLWADGPYPWSWNNGVPETTTPIPTLLCPSDSVNPHPSGSRVAQKNYFFCYGTRIQNNYDQRNNGMFGPDATWGNQPFQPIKLADVTDGTSNTVAMSERAAKPSARQVIGNVAWNSTYDPATCLSYVVGTDYAPNVNLTSWSAGSLWAFGHPHWNAFVTVLPPNGPSCTAHNNDNLSNASGIFTASSKHPGGVQCLMGDGSVRFISQTINCVGGPSGFGVWGALGTRDMGEPVSNF